MLAGDGLTRERTAAAESRVAAVFDRVDRAISTYRDDSELARFNAAGVEPVAVSSETWTLVRRSLEFARETGGAFDPTVGPLVRLWGFGPKGRPGTVPTDAQVREAQRDSGADKVELLPGHRLRKRRPGVRLDLNAIGQGYTVDELAAALDALGFTDYMVEVGGELAARGHNAEGGAWRIGIDRPRAGSAPGEALEAVVRLQDGALSTSGTYRNAFTKDGRDYSHILDPRRGRPVERKVLSASILAPSCADADAAATASIVLGPDAALAWVARRGWEALLIVDAGGGRLEERSTPGFAARLEP